MNNKNICFSSIRMKVSILIFIIAALSCSTVVNAEEHGWLVYSLSIEPTYFVLSCEEAQEKTEEDSVENSKDETELSDESDKSAEDAEDKSSTENNSVSDFDKTSEEVENEIEDSSDSKEPYVNNSDNLENKGQLESYDSDSSENDNSDNNIKSETKNDVSEASETNPSDDKEDSQKNNVSDGNRKDTLKEENGIEILTVKDFKEESNVDNMENCIETDGPGEISPNEIVSHFFQDNLDSENL